MGIIISLRSKSKLLGDKQFNKIMAIAIVLFTGLMSGLAYTVLFSQQALEANAAPPAQEDSDETVCELEVLALEESGNQTISLGFSKRNRLRLNSNF